VQTPGVTRAIRSETERRIPLAAAASWSCVWERLEELTDVRGEKGGFFECGEGATTRHSRASSEILVRTSDPRCGYRLFERTTAAAVVIRSPGAGGLPSTSDGMRLDHASAAGVDDVERSLSN